MAQNSEETVQVESLDVELASDVCGSGSALERRPAIGIVATGTNDDAVVRTALRAEQGGYPVLIAYDDRVDDEVIRFVQRLGVNLVRSDLLPADDESAREFLSAAARDRGFLGTIFNGVADEYVDYDRSVDALCQRPGDSVVATTLPSRPVPDSVDVLAAIPAYNEENAVGSVVAEATEYADAVVVVDDGSTDETAPAAATAGAAVIRHARNGGYGAALKTIFREASRRRARHLVIIDADGQHTAADIPRLVAKQSETEADIVIGSRFAEGAATDAPFYRRAGLFVINQAMKFGLGGTRISDTQSGFRAYNRRAIESLAADGTIGNQMGASTDILFHAHRHGYAIEEVGTTIRYDVENASSQHPLYHGFSILYDIFRMITLSRSRR